MRYGYARGNPLRWVDPNGLIFGAISRGIQNLASGIGNTVGSLFKNVSQSVGRALGSGLDRIIHEIQEVGNVVKRNPFIKDLAVFGAGLLGGVGCAATGSFAIAGACAGLAKGAVRAVFEGKNIGGVFESALKEGAVGFVSGSILQVGVGTYMNIQGIPQGTPGYDPSTIKIGEFDQLLKKGGVKHPAIISGAEAIINLGLETTLLPEENNQPHDC